MKLPWLQLETRKVDSHKPRFSVLLQVIDNHTGEEIATHDYPHQDLCVSVDRYKATRNSLAQVVITTAEQADADRADPVLKMAVQTG
jgi:hypothetical protein